MHIKSKSKRVVTLLGAILLSMNISACSLTKKGVVVEEHSVGGNGLEASTVNTVNLAAVLNSI